MNPKPPATRAAAITESNGIITIRDRLTRNASVDVWRFSSRARSSSNLILNGLGKRANADLEVLNAKGKVVAAARKQGNQQEQLNNVSLEAGTFYIRVVLERGSATRYYWERFIVNTFYEVAIFEECSHRATFRKIGCVNLLPLGVVYRHPIPTFYGF
jgi:hypothetical protein